MTETQKRIKAYKKALPFLKERVGVVALLFIMSITMVGSATFAWITLSRAPEINGLATTIASNGNLEIALSDLDGEAPDETKIGDGSGNILESNLTWGNLINLSHESYGLSNLTLRPAVLNTGSLLTKPLYSVEYTSDGRISNVVSDFAYTNYEEQGGAYDFFVPDVTKYGVRAISSVTYSSVVGDTKLQNLNKAVEQKFATSDNSFKALWNNTDYMNSITGLAGVYLSWRMSDDENGGNVDQDCTSYVAIVYEMLNAYKDCLYKTGETVLAAVNLHYFVYCNQNGKEFKEFTMDQLHDGTVKSAMTSAKITVAGLDPYLADYKTFHGTAAQNYTDGTYSKFVTNVYEPYTKNETIGWVLMSTYINVMANINTATINGTAAQSLGAGDMLSLAFASSIVCELKSGLIWNMDWFYGGNVSVQNVKTQLMGQTKTINEIRTSAKQAVTNGTKSTFPIIATTTQAAEKAAQGGLAATDAVAADSYGMVVDFWLRTNSANSLLTLAGDIVTEQVPLLDAEGNQIVDEETGAAVFETVVTGYSGVNRIWEKGDPELPIPNESSTSQGSGSCYIFYPETPEDQVQALEMLSAMRVAFIDDEGNLLAQADMDTTKAFESMGRVLVPLQLRAKSIVTGTDENGNDIVENAFYITELVQNEATRITAIVYMDGARLENKNVLASGSIKGQLNIQFGTSEDLKALDDDVKSEYYDITVTADKTEFDGYDPANKPKVNLELVLNGMDADNIKGQFVSYISSTQGANQPEFSFEKGDGNVWNAEVEFTGSGNFQLRSIRINGVDYPLSTENIITVEIPGITVSSLYCTGWTSGTKKVMTADSFYTLDSTLTLNIGKESVPKKVQGVFVNDSAQNVTVDYVRQDNGEYKAATTFTTGGTYKMTYIIIDGTYVPLAESMQKTLELYLGLKTQVFLGIPMTESYQQRVADIDDAMAAEIAAYKAANSGMTQEELNAGIASINAKYKAQKDALYNEVYGEDAMNLKQTASGYEIVYDASEPMFMEASCIILDDKGNPIRALEDVVLQYGSGASNKLDSDMTWNSATGRYEGRLSFNTPNNYSFNKLEIGKDEETKNVISVALSAPTVKAISPVPMQYIGASLSNKSYVEDIDPAYATGTKQRLMSVVLQDAAAADVLFTVKNSDTDEILELQGMKSVVVDEATGRVEFAPSHELNGQQVLGLPTDGNWTIIGMTVANVFYDEIYYDGDEENGTGRLDLSEEVAADNITTEFFTTIKFSSTALPSARYEKVSEFMGDVYNKEMRFTLTDYKGDALENASVTLRYVWQENTGNSLVSYSGGTIAENLRILGGETTSSDGKTFNAGTLNFKLDGTYNVVFEVSFDKDVNGETKHYTYNDISKFTTESASSTPTNVTVVWKCPEVTITGVSDHSSKNTFSTYAATVYHYEKEGGCIKDHAPSSVTAKLTGASNMSSATLTFKGSNATVNFTFSSNGASSTQSIGGTGNGSSNSVKLGNVTVTSVVLVHNGISYTVRLAHDVNINNPGTE